jgi:hypothetical protein
MVECITAPSAASLGGFGLFSDDEQALKVARCGEEMAGEDVLFRHREHSG